jgi:hypothetical protein
MNKRMNQPTNDAHTLVAANESPRTVQNVRDATAATHMRAYAPRVGV